MTNSFRMQSPSEWASAAALFILLRKHEHSHESLTALPYSSKARTPKLWVWINTVRCLEHFLSFLNNLKKHILTFVWVDLMWYIFIKPMLGFARDANVNYVLLSGSQLHVLHFNPVSFGLSLDGYSSPQRRCICINIHPQNLANESVSQRHCLW